MKKIKEFLKSNYLLIVMIIFLIILSLFIIINENNTNNTKPDSNEKIIDTKNLFTINELSSYLSDLNDSNFEYNYNIQIADEVYRYSGIRYDNNYKGIYKGLDTEIHYQIENDICYDSNTKEEIFNVHYNVNIGFIDLVYLNDLLNDEKTKCIKENDIFECSTVSNSDEVELRFILDNKNIEKINITIAGKADYSLNYSNVNNVNSFEKINDHIRFNFSFNESEEIDRKEISDFGTFNYYKVSEVEYIINNEKYNLDSTTIDDFLNQSLYKIERDNSLKYFYEDGLIIYEVKNYSNLRDIYVSLEKYNNEILKEINEKSN